MPALDRMSRIPTSYVALLLLIALSMLFTFRAVSLSGVATGVPSSKLLSRDSASKPDPVQSAALLGTSTADGSRSAAAAAPSATEPAAVKALPEPLPQHSDKSFDASSSLNLPQQPSDSACPVLSSSSLRALSPSSPESPPLLPWPSSVMVGSQGEGLACEAAGSCCGPFTIGDSTPVFVVSPQSKGISGVKAIVQRAAVAFSALSQRDAVLLPRITVCIDRPEENPNAGVSEEYSLRVSGSGILISCSNKAGLAWALSTLMQLLTHWPISKTCAALISDKPLLGHRGVLLDVARNFVPVPAIVLLLSTMSAAKLNVLHMHLTDDQAFAFASASCPEFTSSDPSMRSRQYSPADLRSLVSTAADLGIRIIPELDVPGHAAGFRFGNAGYIASCPAYIAKYKHWGIPLNPSHPQLMPVIARLIQELSTIFPDKYVHLGGDEVSRPCWLEDAAFKTWVQSQEGKTVPHGDGININMKWRDEVTTDASALLMLDFIKFARENRKSVIVYQEVFDHQRINSNEHSVSQIWISKFALTEHVNRGVNAISSWGWYLNHGAEQCNSAHECYSIDHLRDIDNFQKISAEGRNRIMGGEMALWEVETSQLQDTLWPRAGGIAERLWSGHIDVGGADQQQKLLSKRLQPLLDDMKLLGWLKCADCAVADKKARP